MFSRLSRDWFLLNAGSEPSALRNISSIGIDRGCGMACYKSTYLQDPMERYIPLSYFFLPLFDAFADLGNGPVDLEQFF